jgi:hypothetical protein
MSTIDPSSPLFAQIRAQALAWKKRVAGRGGTEKAAEEQSTDTAGASQDWLVQVARSVVAIGPDDPEPQRKAFRIYLQAVLARECRIRAGNDPGFQELVDRVQETMEADPRLRTAMLAAGAMLLRSADR